MKTSEGLAADAAKPPRHDRTTSESPRAEEATGPATGNEHHAEIAHAIHGRVRLKFPGAKHDPTLLSRISTAFEGLPGVQAVNVKPHSGSLVIHYDPAQHPDIPSLFLNLNKMATAPDAPRVVTHAPRVPRANRIEEATRSIEAETEAEFLAGRSTLARSVVEAARELDRHIKRISNNNIDLKILVPVGIVAVTVLEIGATAATPMWMTAMIFSLNHFVELRAQDADDKRDADDSGPV